MKKGILTGNALKIIALIAMTIDHVGKVMFPSVELFSVVGRLAYPIFGYLIAEGCFYTGSRVRYFCTMAGVGAVCQLVYYFAENSLYQCILITFSLSIVLIYALDTFVKRKDAAGLVCAAFSLAVIFFVSEILPHIIPGTDFRIDYGFWGIVFPALIYFAGGKASKIVMMMVGLLPIAVTYGGVQWFSYAAVPVLALYNGKRGKYRLKYLFYLYYPLHLGVIYIVDTVIKKLL